MNKAELLEALQRKTKLRPTHVKRVVDAIFDPVEGVISRQIKRGGKVTIAGFGTFDRRSHKARDVNSVFTGRTVKVKARKIPGFRAGVSFKDVAGIDDLQGSRRQLYPAEQARDEVVPAIGGVLDECAVRRVRLVEQRKPPAASASHAGQADGGRQRGPDAVAHRVGQ